MGRLLGRTAHVIRLGSLLRFILNGFYPTGANDTALDCIFSQRGGDR